MKPSSKSSYVSFISDKCILNQSCSSPSSSKQYKTIVPSRSFETETYAKALLKSSSSFKSNSLTSPSSTQMTTPSSASSPSSPSSPSAKYMLESPASELQDPIMKFSEEPTI